MALGNCNLGLSSNPAYKILQDKAKFYWGALYTDEAFDAVIQRYYDANNSFPTVNWIRYNQEQNRAAKPKEAEKNLSLSPETPEAETTQKEQPQEKENTRIEKTVRTNWAQSVSDGQGFEVSDNGNELGKKFSPLRAILPKGASLTFGRGTNSKTYDLSDLPIESAFAVLKGYDQAGNRRPTRVSEVVGYGEKPRKGSPLAFTYDSENRTYQIYLKLWQMFADANPELMQQLREATQDGKLVLTYAFAGHKNGRKNINQARALAEILFGAPEKEATEKQKAKLERQRKNAEAAVKDIFEKVQRNPKVQVIEVTLGNNDSETKAVRSMKHLDEHDNQIVQSGDRKFPEPIITFPLKAIGFMHGYNQQDAKFINPFEGQENALEKFVMWLIPDSDEVLPKELRGDARRQAQRDYLRSNMSKGHFRDRPIYTTDKGEGLRYADVLKYMIDNFAELRKVYNPLSEKIQDWAAAKQNVVVSDPYNISTGDDGKLSATKFYVREDVTNEDVQDNEGQPIRYCEVINTADNTFVVRFSTENLNKSQKDRLFKSVAASIPIGASLSLQGAVSEEDIAMLEKVSRYGFKRAERSISLPLEGTGNNVNTPVFERVADQKQMFYRQQAPYTREEAREHISDRFYLYGDTWETLDKKVQGPTKSRSVVRGLPNAMGIPVKLKPGNFIDQSYYKDTPEARGQFKEAVDKVIAEARRQIAQGKQIVVPREGIFGVNDKLPEFFQNYLTDALNALEEEANAGYNAEIERSKQSSNVNRLDKAPVESKAIGRDIEQSPYVKIHNQFANRVELSDAIDVVARYFIELVEEIREEWLDEIDEELEGLKEDEEGNKDKIAELQEQRWKVADEFIGKQMALKHETGDDKRTIVEKLQEVLSNRATSPYISEERKRLYGKAADPETLNVLLQYASDTIDQCTGMRVLVVHNNVTATKSKNVAEEESNEDDPEGKRTTGNDGWSFNVRLNDPYKSLTVGVRRAISNIVMKDPDNENRTILNSFGESRYWNPKYIYASIMSFMAKNLRNNADNFVVITPYDQLSEEDKKHFPLGKPSFPLFEKMKLKYSWAEDLITKLWNDYYIYDADTATKEEIDNLGKLVTQLYVNFNQQFINYYIMKDGRLYSENYPTGSESLRESVMNNYEGGVQLIGSDGKPLDMLYHPDGRVNKERASQLDGELAVIQQRYKKERRNIDGIVKDYYTNNKGESVFKTYKGIPAEIKSIMVDLSNVAKSMGVNLSPYDFFCMTLDNPGITSEFTRKMRDVLNSAQSLEPGDHLISSGRGMNANGYGNIEQDWAMLFKQAGEYVSDKEYQSSFYAKDGTTRYSYSAPSFMSSMIINLTARDENGVGIELRRAFIEENFMPYSMFYDSKKGKWRNKVLEALYEGSDNALGDGHDVISIFMNGTNIKYSDWTPELIEDLMLKEYFQGTNQDKTANYIIPILSDKECCKVVKMGKQFADVVLGDMQEVVFQEYERIKLVKERKKLLALQNRMLNGDTLDKDEQNYLKEHEGIFDVANFDTSGDKFSFFPELNSIQFKASNDPSVESIRSEIGKLLDAAGDSTIAQTYSFLDALTLIEEMEDGKFNELISQSILGQEVVKTYNVATKENLMRFIAVTTLEYTTKQKFRSWACDSYGNIKTNLINSLASVDEDILEARQNLPSGDTLSKEQLKRIEEFKRSVENRLYEFYVNHTYAMSQFIQIMATDTAFFKDSIDFSKRWFSIYGAGSKLNTNSRYGKKKEGYIILKDNKRRSRSYDVIDAALQQRVEAGALTKIEKEVILNKFKKINATDAQAFRGLTSYRAVMDMAGRWTPAMERAYQNLKDGNWTMADFNTVYQTIKPFVFSNIETETGLGDKMRVPTIHKNSEAVLLAIYHTLIGAHKGDKNYSARAAGINMAMENEDMALVDENGDIVRDIDGNPVMAIDVAQYESSTKVSGQGIIDINYSRIKLKEALNKGKVTYTDEDSGETISVSIERQKQHNTTYYKFVDKLDDMLDNHEITQKQYDGLLDELEPDAEEVKSIIKDAVTFDNSRLGTKPSQGKYNRQVLHEVSYSDYCIQQPTPEHLIDVDKSVFSSQIRHIIISDIPETNPDGTPWKLELTNPDGSKRTYKRDELRKHYNSLIVSNLLQAYEETIQSMFESSEGHPIYGLQRMLLSQIQGNDKYGREVEQALEIVTDPETGQPTFALPLNNINVTVKIEELLTSLFKNRITKQTIKGGSAILAADIGYADSLKIVGERDADGNLIPGKIKGIECFLPANARALYEPFLIEKTDEQGNKYWVLDEEKAEKAGLNIGIGYRIPTEAHYSIMPLIIKGFLPQQSGSMIVLAKEVVTLSGSDNDVDKEFLFLKSFYIDEETGQPKIINYKPDVPDREQSKEARDNEIIDIMHAILRHPAMADKWMKPGNFDTIKLNGGRLRILKNRDLFEKYKQANGFNTDEAALKDLKGSKYTKEELQAKIEKFLKDYEPVYSPVYPDTFIHYHAQNMAGVAEKGIFANNNIAHAKLQWVDISLTEAHQFTINGRHIKKIDPVEIEIKAGGNIIKERVSANCAECSAASVDNAKDPQLANINSNIKTASVLGYMLRMGLTIEEVSLLLAQPDIDYIINKHGELRYDKIAGPSGVVSEIAAILKANNIDVFTTEECDWHSPKGAITTDELYYNIVFAKKLVYDIQNKGRKAFPDDLARLKSMYKVYSLIADIVLAQKDFATQTRPLTADSPTHAIAKSFAGAVLQTKDVEDVNNRQYDAADSKYFTGTERLLVYQIDKQEQEDEGKDQEVKRSFSSLQALRQITKKGKNDVLYDKIMKSDLPITQAFYTLGIEKAREAFKSELLFGRPEVQELTDRLCNLMRQRGIYKLEEREKILTQAYKDLIVFFLSKTNMFGDSEDGTYDEKRQYYIYQFPTEFLRFKAVHPEINQLESIARMTVKNNVIIMNRQGKLTTTERNILIDAFEDLITDSNGISQEEREARHWLATQLMMYCYYLNGYDFSHMSFGNLLGTQYLRRFPEYIKALRDMQTMPITEVDMDRFLIQFVLKRNNMRLLENIDYSSANGTSSKSETLQEGFFNSGRNLNWYGDNVDDIPQFITVDGKEVYQYSPILSKNHGSLCFVPLRQSTSLHYNANQSIEELTSTVYDEQLVKESRNVGTKYRSAVDVQRELVGMNNNPQVIDMTSHNSYTIDVEHPSKAQINNMAGLAPADGKTDSQSAAQKATNSLEAKETDAQLVAEGLTDVVVTSVVDREEQLYKQIAELQDKVADPDDAQRKIDEALASGNLDDPFCPQ